MMFLPILTMILYHIVDNKKWLFLQILLITYTYFSPNAFDEQYLVFLVLLSFIFLILQPLFISLKDNKLKSIKVPYFIYGYELHILTPTVVLSLISLLCMILELDFSPFFLPIIILFLLFVYWKYHLFNKWETLRKHLLYNYLLVIPIVAFFFYQSLDFWLNWMWSFAFLIISTLIYLYLFLFNLPTYLLYLENDND